MPFINAHSRPQPSRSQQHWYYFFSIFQNFHSLNMLVTSLTADSAAFSAVHSDIINTHILTRLDGPSLAAAGCASSQLHSLTTDEDLWRRICCAAWPSIEDSCVSHVVSTFQSGHRSLFSDSFPFFDSKTPDSTRCHQRDYSSDLAAELISAVDIFYGDDVVFSRVLRTDTSTGWFRSTPFRVELLDPKDPAPTPVLYGGEEQAWLKSLEENLRLSWIVIDPTRKRAVNVSSRRAVEVRRHWLTGEAQVKYSTVAVGTTGHTVEMAVVVTCGGKEGGAMQVVELSMQVEDMDGRGLNGEDSLVILENVMESGRRRELDGNDAKKRYRAFVERKRELRELREKREKFIDMVFVVIGIVVFLGFWSFVLFR